MPNVIEVSPADFTAEFNQQMFLYAKSAGERPETILAVYNNATNKEFAEFLVRKGFLRFAVVDSFDSPQAAQKWAWNTFTEKGFGGMTFWK
jgi:hypothetical protein